MYIEKLNLGLSFNRERVETFLSENDLLLETGDSCYAAFENGKIIACGCRDKNVLKCFAVDENYRGASLFDAIISSLVTECYTENIKTIFVFTKIKNITFFESAHFKIIVSGNYSALLYKSDVSITETIEALSRKNNFDKKITSYKNIGAVVINANPFTLGHRYLIETAAHHVDFLLVFVVEENRSFFSFDERFFLVKQGTADLSNVLVLPSTNFLISAATFPSYFLKEKKLISSEHALIDARVFARYFVPAFKISVRFLGDEPIDKSTQLYNETLQTELPKASCTVKIIPRLTTETGIVSASLVRKYFLENNFEKIKPLVPQTTFDLLKQKTYETK